MFGGRIEISLKSFGATEAPRLPAVTTAFGADIKEILGLRGTVFLADTRGLHKGLEVRKGNRLVFQTEYSSSLFGSPYPRVVVRRPSPEFAKAIANNGLTFQRFSLGERP